MIVQVQHAEWAAPIILVLKSNGTANKATMTEEYPLLQIKDLLAFLVGGTVFSN